MARALGKWINAKNIAERGQGQMKVAAQHLIDAGKGTARYAEKESATVSIWKEGREEVRVHYVLGILSNN